MDALASALAEGADVDAADTEGFTAAHMAAIHGREACLRALLQAGAQADARDARGWTPAMQAASYGERACVEALCERGADLRANNNEGQSAAMVAASEGHASLSAFIAARELSSNETEALRLSADEPGSSARLLRLRI